MKPIVRGLCITLAAWSGVAAGGCASHGTDPAAAAPEQVAGTVAAEPKSSSPPPVQLVDARPTGRVALTAAGPAPAAGDTAIAHVNGRTITLSQILGPLVESHGLSVLLSIVQLELAKDAAAKSHLTITPDDVVHEREYTLGRLFQEYDEKMDERIADAQKAGAKAEAVELFRKEKQQAHDQLLAQFFTQQRISPAEFELLLQTNAHLRKMAEPLLEGKITDDDLTKQFRTKYGETIRLRHIELDQRADVWEAKRRLATGEPFDKVAREMSKHPQTAPLGGEMPPFGREDTRFPQNFKDVAFALKNPGDVAEDVIEAGGAFHIIKLEQRIMPKAVKFEDVKDGLFKELHERYTQVIMARFRDKIGAEARANLKIDDPVLNRQFAQRLADFEAQAKGQQQGAEEQMQQQWQRDRDQRAAPATGPATAPSVTAPAPVPAAPAPASRPAGTQPAAAISADEEFRRRVQIFQTARAQREAELKNAGVDLSAVGKAATGTPATAPAAAPAAPR